MFYVLLYKHIHLITQKDILLIKCLLGKLNATKIIKISKTIFYQFYSQFITDEDSSQAKIKRNFCDLISKQHMATFKNNN